MGLPEQGFRALGGFGKAMNEYFRWNYSQSLQGLVGYGDMVKAGLPSNQAFGATIAGTTASQYAMNNVLRGRDRETKRPQVGDNYDSSWLNPVYDATIGFVLPDEGKIERRYSDYVARVYKNGGKDADVLTEDAYNAFKDRTYNAGGKLRYNERGVGSEIPNRDTITFFNKTLVNPLYAYDSTIGADTVDKLTAVGTGLTLAGSAAALYEPTQLAKAKAPLPVFDSSGTLIKGAQNARMSAQVVGGGLAKIAGVAGSIYGGITDYANSKAIDRDSDFRAGTNAVASTGGGLAGAAYGASVAAPFAVASGPFAPLVIGGAAIAGSLLGSYTAGWASDRVLDAAGEGKSDSGDSDFDAKTAQLRKFYAEKGDPVPGYPDRGNSTPSYTPSSYTAPEFKEFKDYDYRATKTYAEMQNFAKNFNPSDYGDRNYDYSGFQLPASMRSDWNAAMSDYQQYSNGY